MKTSHILIILAIVIIGFIFFFNSSADPDNSVQDTDSDTTSEESTNNLADEQTSVESTANEDAVQTTEEAASDVDESTESVDKEFTIDAFNYGYSQEEIRVQQGDTVTINLTNSDGFHDWVVDEFDAATEQINASETTSVTFVADEAGTFEYYCSVGNHRQQGMVGNIIVE